MASKWFHKIVVGISGGVDSAVSAYLLKQRGFNVVGVYMQNWDTNDEQGVCSQSQDIKDAQYCCDKLSIPFYHVNFVKEYWNFVFNSFIEDYQNGLTPNPDILCNRYLKFNYFYRYAIETQKADAIATGHYVRTSFGNYLEHYRPNTKVKLLQPADSWKDQTFFLSQVEQIPLQKSMFPLGDLLKTEVKLIANDIGLSRLSSKKESMGICFIGNRNFRQFICEYVDNKTGNFIDVETGKTIGEHPGVHYWTNGQRTRLALDQRPIYVVKKIASNNNVLVGRGRDHPALYSDSFITDSPHWIYAENGEMFRKKPIFSCGFKFQHVDRTMSCILYQLDNSRLFVKLERFCRAITPGQFAVFYKDNECLGSARIIQNGPLKFTQHLKEFLS